jgi:hypothetical protein
MPLAFKKSLTSVIYLIKDKIKYLIEYIEGKHGNGARGKGNP